VVACDVALLCGLQYRPGGREPTDARPASGAIAPRTAAVLRGFYGLGGAAPTDQAALAGCGVRKPDSPAAVAIE
jgi:hypothetical protein